ncbi:exonuclease domain-containing protein [Endozoicomonas sp.]|uniref:exonuclease domain-containing protein n=1 Tax=Endozoicomonas sp. TaxID=1892382 RepID=UPI002885C597|nr:exonuclease domain-containing protein [Endozoicomonas sp.]
MASICQIGIAQFEDGKLVNEWSSLVSPEDYFDPINVGIHGINEADIRDAPTFPEVYEQLHNLLADTVTVSHSHFDRVSVGRSIAKHSLKPIMTEWLDSARVVRRAWDECARKGYGLANVCKIIGYEFDHHDALEDAKACGYVLLAAIEKTGISLEQWQSKVTMPIGLSTSSSGRSGTSEKIKREGNPEGEFYGEILVFTGALIIPRREAADLASTVGCTVASSVTKKTTMLVVGDQEELRGINGTSINRGN